MSTSDSFPKFSLTVEVADEYKYLVKVFLFDSTGRIIEPLEKSRYHYLYQVKKGLYTLRVEMNAQINDKVVTVQSDQKYLVTCDYSLATQSNIIEPPQQFSSALLSGENLKTYGSSHEYYTGPAIELSKRDTFIYNSIVPVQSNSSLFIFMRFPSIDKYKSLRNKWDKSFYKDFEIVSEFGNRIIHFNSGNGLEINEDHGWVAFNAKLPNGIYYLIYGGSEPRQIPIYVFKNWHTQFFMTLGEVPLFGTIRIFISGPRAFNPKAKSNKYIDILLDKLQNGDYSIDEELIEITAHGKFDSPMLGLICSYVYLKSNQTKSDDLFKIIIKNMQQIILKDNDESPDLRALDILAVEHFVDTGFKKTKVQGTPMLRIGFEAIKKASIKNRELISQNSINDFISETLYYDSPFNTFQPITTYDNSLTEKGNNSFNKPTTYFLNVDQNEKTKARLNTRGLEIDKYSLRIQDYFGSSVIRSIRNSELGSGSEKNWIRVSISDLLNKNKDLSINDISSQLNLSVHTVTRILDDWTKEIRTRK